MSDRDVDFGQGYSPSRREIIVDNDPLGIDRTVIDLCDVGHEAPEVSNVGNGMLDTWLTRAGWLPSVIADTTPLRLVALPHE